MKINEVEAAVGVTKKNIRFYEEEGLISPRREPGNGYRSYSEADVERLRRIKLLRKLDVPLAEIRQMLEGECTLAEGMTRQLERLHTRRTDLDEAVNFCTLLQKEPVSLNELDVEQTLARLTAKEEQGVSFVNIEQTVHHGHHGMGRLRGPGGDSAAAAAGGTIRHPGGLYHRHAEGAGGSSQRDRKGRRRCLS